MSIGIVLRRLGMALLVIWTASTLIFFVPRIAPRNPIEDKLLEAMQQGGSATAMRALVEVYNAKFGLDLPLWRQYANSLSDMARFDLGYSIA